VDKGTQIRIVLYILTWLNVWLAKKGLFHLEVKYINDETAALVLTFLISSWTTFKNNYLTRKGKAQERVLERHDLK
jgi:SPP1 family holin